MKPKILFLFFISSLFIGCFSKTIEQKKIDYTIENAESVLPKPIGFVNDFSSVFTANENEELECFLKEYSDKTTNQIAVVTVDNILPYTDIKDYANDLGNFWEIGQNGKDNGLIIVLNMHDRQIRIGTGFGTEKVLSEKFLLTVIDKQMVPYFKEEKYFGGIMVGLDKIMTEWSRPSE